MEKEKLRAALAAAVFFLLICVAAFLPSGNFLGQTLGAAFLPGGKKAQEPEQALTASQKELQANPEKVTPLPPKEIDTKTLWLARCVYSETKRPEEQELVAWVVRNRVETHYRGNASYRAAILDPYQFSAFNPGSRKRGYYASLDAGSTPPGWQRALVVAHQVLNAPSAKRPFPKETRHFFSERSMHSRQSPSWAKARKKVTPKHHKINEDRFRFYKDVF